MCYADCLLQGLFIAGYVCSADQFFAWYGCSDRLLLGTCVLLNVLSRDTCV